MAIHGNEVGLAFRAEPGETVNATGFEDGQSHAEHLGRICFGGGRILADITLRTSYASRPPRLGQVCKYVTLCAYTV